MSSPILERVSLGFPWVTTDPFLFCVHHDDAYPRGNEHLGPDASLEGRDIGQDFAGKDGWRMYHGEVVPGFPQHPHRGFETVTIVRKGFIDHSDSLGATSRFGEGDLQWLTAGEGIVHAEMFPLVSREEANPVELFQIWLNLPAEDKMAPPHFSMFWSTDIPRLEVLDEAGRGAVVTVFAGEIPGAKAPTPPPRSWATRADTEVGIFSIALQPGATWTLPKTRDPRTVRTVYFFRGDALSLGGDPLAPRSAAVVDATVDIRFEAGREACEALVLQGRPIAQPVVQHGPFVMNSADEIRRAMADYQRTRFGGWPWKENGPVHARDAGRFVKYLDGRFEQR